VCFCLPLPRFFLNVGGKDSHPISPVATSLQFKIETLFYLTNAFARFIVYSHVRTLSPCHKAPQHQCAVQSVKNNSFCADVSLSCSETGQCGSQDAAATICVCVCVRACHLESHRSDGGKLRPGTPPSGLQPSFAVTVSSIDTVLGR